MTALNHILRDFFKRLPLPATAVQFSSRYLSGVQLAPKENRIKAHFVIPVAKGIIEPSFYKKNIKDGAQLEQSLAEGMARLNPGRRRAVLLLPELSQKAFIFSFEGLPSSPEEREELIRFRIKKQMPLLPDDIRMDFDTYSDGKTLRVVAAVAKTEVVQEYEAILQRLRFKVVLAGVPSMSLLNLLDPAEEKNFILLDVEDDSFSLIAVTGGRAALYRQKPFGIDAGTGEGVTAKADNIVQEVVNTIHFVEDREKERLAVVWLRLGIQQAEDGLYARMEQRLALPLRRIETVLPSSLDAGSLRILSPLIGQIT